MSFRMLKDTSCDFSFVFIDVNECLPPIEIQKTNMSKCVLNSQCVNLDGDYECKCGSGFSGNGTTRCSGK